MHKSLRKAYKKLSKFERAQVRQEKLKNVLHGEGKYIFQNNTSGELTLPKEPLEGSRQIPKNGKFLGDSYFLQMVRSHDLRLIEEITMENKLITEQPPTVTHGGIVELVQPEQANSKAKKLNEQVPEDEKKTVLLTEDPLGGVVIVD